MLLPFYQLPLKQAAAMSTELTLRSLLGVHPDFPQKGKPFHRNSDAVTTFSSLLPPGIIFLDLFPILQDPIAFEMLITTFMNHIFSVSIPASPSKKVDVVVGLDARCVLNGGTPFQRARADGKPLAVDSFSDLFSLCVLELLSCLCARQASSLESA